MKLGHKLLLAPIATAVAVLAVSQLDTFLVNRANDAAIEGFREHMGEISNLAALQGEVNSVHVGVYRTMTIIGSLDDGAIQKQRKDIQSRVGAVKGKLDQLIGEQTEGSELRKLLQETSAQLDRYTKSADSAVDLASVDVNTGVAAMQGADEAYQKLAASLSKTDDMLVGHAAADATAKKAAAERNHWLLGLLSLVVAGAVVGLAGVLLRKVARSLEQASRVARNVADGDLTQNVETGRNDELGELLKALGAMKESLLKTVVQVRHASDSIGTASAEIASGNQDLSSRTEQAASSL
uniref:HAMP domain-containing protein n=1 Tax=Hydrogenophaga sp. TaxID=1904254 RepID=UPI0035AE4AB7